MGRSGARSCGCSTGCQPHPALDAVAVPDPVAAPPGATVAEVEALAHRRGFSRVPLRGEDGWRGYVHVKDLVGLPGAERDRPVPGRVVRRLERVESATTLGEALAGMRRSGSHLALVDGAAPRIVTLDDVLAELVGEIRHVAAA